LVISGNQIVATAAHHGGISVSDVEDCSIVGNTYNDGGFANDIGPIEVVAGTNVSVIGNTITSTATGSVRGITASTGNTNLSIVGNTIRGFGTGSAAAGISITSSTADTVEDIVVSSNQIDFTASATGRGLRFQCNHASAVLRNFLITSNVFRSDGTASSTGIRLDENSGTMSNFTISGNQVDGAETGILGSSGISSLSVYGNTIIGATTDYSTLTGENLSSTTGRIKSTIGTSLVAGDFALSAGFGSTASIGTITGTDQRFRATITSAGTGQGANPTCILTFQDGTWTTAPFFTVSRGGGSQATVQFEVTTITATALTLTFQGTPSAAETYVINVVGIG